MDCERSVKHFIFSYEKKVLQFKDYNDQLVRPLVILLTSLFLARVMHFRDLDIIFLSITTRCH